MPEFAKTVNSNITLTTTTETVCSVTGAGSVSGAPLAQPPGNNMGLLAYHGVINITPGTGTTALVLRVRLGNSIAGAIWGPAAGVTINVTAGSPISIPWDFIDAAGATADAGQVCMTVQQTGATANGTVNYNTGHCDQN